MILILSLHRTNIAINVTRDKNWTSIFLLYQILEIK